MIAVSGRSGKVTRARVTLNRIAHGDIDELVFLVTSPSGASTVLYTRRCSGQNTETAPITFTFDDAGPQVPLAPGPCVSGTYRPTRSYDPKLPYPAPAPPLGTSLSALTGASPNGLWQLFAYDSVSFIDGEVSGGWSLDLTLSKPKCKKSKGKRRVAAKKKRCKKKPKKG